MEFAESTSGKLDILVNNAAIAAIEGIMETSIELWDRVVAINQTGTFLGMRAAVPAMRRAGGGSIVNISSVLATMGSGNSASYTATKGAVTALTRTVAVELATERIRVNVVHPGGVETPMADEILGDDAEARRALVATAPDGADRRAGGDRGRRALPGERRGLVRHGRDARDRRRQHGLVIVSRARSC